AIASAYWRTKLAAISPDAAEAASKLRAAALEALGEWADTLEKRYAKLRPIASQAPRRRAFAAARAKGPMPPMNGALDIRSFPCSNIHSTTTPFAALSAVQSL